MLRLPVFVTLATLVFGSVGIDVGATSHDPVRAVGHERLPHVAPESVGMSASRLAALDGVRPRGTAACGAASSAEVWRWGLPSCAWPGAAVTVGRRGGIVWERGYGTLDWQSGIPV